MKPNIIAMVYGVFVPFVIALHPWMTSITHSCWMPSINFHPITPAPEAA